MPATDFDNWITKNLTQFSSSNITKLAPGIFVSQSNLTTVNIPNVTVLSKKCFAYCYNLTSLTTGTLVRLEEGCLIDCGIYDIDVSNVTYVGNSALLTNRNLQSLDFSNLQVLAQGALWNLSVNKIWIPSTCTILGVNFYSDNPNLKIYTDAESKPDSWESSWNDWNKDIIWGATHADFENA